MAHLQQATSRLFGTTLIAKVFIFLNENLLLGWKHFQKSKCFGHERQTQCLPLIGGNGEMFSKYPQILWGKCSHLINSWLRTPSFVRCQTIKFLVKQAISSCSGIVGFLKTHPNYNADVKKIIRVIKINPHIYVLFLWTANKAWFVTFF